VPAMARISKKRPRHVFSLIAVHPRLQIKFLLFELQKRVCVRAPRSTRSQDYLLARSSSPPFSRSGFCQGYGPTQLRVLARDPIGKQDSSLRDSSP